MTPTSSTKQNPTGTFEIEVQAALVSLQSALGAAFDAFPQHPRKAPELIRQLGLERNLAWKLFRLVHEPDAFVAARFVPGLASIDAFIAAAAAVRVKAAILERVRESSLEYAEVVRVHAGDRASADIMLGRKAGEAGDLAIRRSGFRAMSSLAGVQAQTQLQTFILAPSASDPAIVDGVAVKGFIDLQRLRPDAPVVISRSLATDDRGAVVAHSASSSIDPLTPGQFVPLLLDFCSSPLPQFKRVAAEPPFVEDELMEGPVGKTAALTFVAANIIRGLGRRYLDKDNERMDMVTRIRTPAASLICDLLVHDDVFGVEHPVAPSAGVYSDLFCNAMMRGAARDRYRLAGLDRVEYLGHGSAVLQTADIPRYPKMINHIMDQLGWNAAKFGAHRVRLDYPHSPSSLLISLDLLPPERG